MKMSRNRLILWIGTTLLGSGLVQAQTNQELRILQSEQEASIERLKNKLDGLTSDNTTLKSELTSSQNQKEEEAQQLREEILRATEEQQALMNQLEAAEQSLARAQNKTYYDQITFKSGVSFVGKIDGYKNGSVVLRSKSGKTKTGKVSMLKKIVFDQEGLSPEEFPQVAPRKPPTQEKQETAQQGPSHMELLAIRRQIKCVVKPLRTEKDDGITKRGRVTYHGAGFNKVQFNISLSYNNPVKTLENVSVEMYALARDEADKKLGQVLIKETKKVPVLTKTPLRIQSKEVKTVFYDNAFYVQGFSYHGYLVVVSDEFGNTLFTKSSHSKFKTLHEKIRTLKPKAEFSY